VIRHNPSKRGLSNDPLMQIKELNSRQIIHEKQKKKEKLKNEMKRIKKKVEEIELFNSKTQHAVEDRMRYINN